MSHDDLIDRAIGILRDADYQPTPDSVADVIWFAGQLSAGRVASVAPAEQSDEVVEPVDGPVPDDHDAAPAEPGDIAENVDEPTFESDDDVVPTVPHQAGPPPEERYARIEVPRAQPTPGPPGVPVRVPGAPALARLGMARALRPLKRRVNGKGIGALDAEATARHAAQTDVLVPVFAPRPERWLDVAVVVDAAPSMVVSEQTVQDLVAILEELGAFRDVRVWLVDSTSDQAPLRVRAGGPDATWRDPREIVDPTGRRAVVVVADCLGTAWRDGRMADVLDVWARSAPVAIVQPLPQRRWAGCGLVTREVSLWGDRPGTPNRSLSVEIDDDFFDSFDAEDDSVLAMGSVVPVIELSQRWLASWAALVSGESAQRLPGRAAFTAMMRGGTEPAPDDEPEVESAVARFMAEASPDAYELAKLLAAAAPLTLPVIRLIKEAKLPQSPSSAVPEVFLGNLLEIVNDSSVADPYETTYDFLPGIREELIARLGRADALSVLTEVSRYLVQHWGSDLDFLALLRMDGPIGDLDARGRAFAKITIEVLKSIGGTYREKALRLENQLNQVPVGWFHDLAPEPQAANMLDATNHAEPEDPTPPSNMVEISSVSSHSPGEADMVIESQPPIQASATTSRRKTPVGWKSIPPRNPNFVGRDEMLASLRNMLVNRSQTAILLPRALYGLGGVGKTQLAGEYVHRQRDDYDLVWWVAAEDPAEVRRSLVDLADELNIPVTNDTSETIRRVRDALSSRKPYAHWLIVFDNVGDPATLRELLPDPRGGHVLITTRDRRWETEGRAVEVGSFDRSESVTLLRARASTGDADANEIAARLQDLPISLAQAAAWLKETKQPASAYLDRFNEELGRRPEDPRSEYPREAAAAMNIAFDQLQTDAKLAAQLLQLASYFGPEWISLDMLHRGRLATTFSRALGPVLRDQAPLQRTVRDINKLELARFDSRNNRFQIHRLVQSMVQADMSQQQRDEVRRTVQEMLAYANPGNPDLISDDERAKHAQLSAHIVASGVIQSDEDEHRQVVLDQIRYRYIVGDFESSEALATQAVQVWESHGNRDDTFTLIARRHGANAIRALGDAARSLDINRELRDRFVATLGPLHEHTFATVNTYAADLRALGRFREARELDDQNYQNLVTELGSEDRSTLRSASNLGVDLRMVGEYDQALEIDEETSATARRVLGPDDSMTLTCSSNVARDLYSLGRFDEALRRQTEDLPLFERVLGVDHVFVLLARRTIVMSLRKLGRVDKAAEDARTLQLAFRNRLGDTHPETLLVSQSLLNALRDNSEVAEAVRVGQQTLEMYRERLPDHPFYYVCCANHAIGLRQAGRVREARKLNEEALQGLQRQLGEKHPYTLCCATNLASDLDALNENIAAVELSAATFERSRDVRGSDHPYTLACAINHAVDLIATGDRAGGETLRADTIDKMRRMPNIGPAHPDTMLATDGRRINCDIEPPPV
ncbi:FxSxx-COOH system tetratricopeptide repeat protein [Asanoa iriomotensis]|uniref:Cytochrome c n=1 Tax=Asanoa iriomotensis TaxID=234613 RepID=A0ABQ4CE74_9ACTN|nr:FxSxx-COOH system tetratricopeptide repeat protein [Asanoa iriomotensis]GIF61050.1 cytochrome c [Asanoa iriomotensis]